jgi:hypothetical protein
MASLCHYDKGTVAAEGRRYVDDIDSANDALARTMGIVNTHHRKTRRAKPPFHITLGNHPLTPDHQLMTKEGWKFHDEVEEGTLVLTRDEDGVAEWQPILAKIEKQVDEPIYMYDSQTVSLSCTNTHRVLYKTSGGKETYKPAGDVPNSFDIICSAKAMGNRVGFSDDELRLAAVLCTDSHHTKLGGFVLYQSGEKAAVIKQLLDDLGVMYTHSVRDRAPEEICGKVLKSHKLSHEFHVGVKQGGPAIRARLGVLNNLRLPEWAIGLPQDQWEVFKDMLIFCDGTTYSDGRPQCMFYGKKEICEDFQCAAVAHNARASLREYRPGHWRVNYNPSCHKSRVDGFQESLVHYKGTVWCISTSNTNFFTRLKGNIHVTGNCNRIHRAAQADPTLHGKLSMDDLHFKKYGWNVVPFLDPLVIEGVVFKHYFTSGTMGRPIGGQNHARSLVTKNYQSCVCGHSHSRDFYEDTRADGSKIMGLVVGHFDDGEHHYTTETKRWWSGLVMMHEVKDGAFEPAFYSIDYINRKYL